MSLLSGLVGAPIGASNESAFPVQVEFALVA